MALRGSLLTSASSVEISGSNMAAITGFSVLVELESLNIYENDSLSTLGDGAFSNASIDSLWIEENPSLSTGETCDLVLAAADFYVE